MSQTTLTRSQLSEVFPAVIFGARDLPRKPLTLHVLLISATLGLQPDRAYTEAEINGHLQRWILAFGVDLPIDHVELRRNLVDAGYLDRDPGGARYKPRPRGGAFVLDAAVDEHDLETLVTAERSRRARRKQEFADRSNRSGGGA